MIQDIAPHRLENPFDLRTAPEAGDLLFVEKDRKFLMRLSEDDICFPEYDPQWAGTETPLYLFRLDGRACFWIRDPEQFHQPRRDDAKYAWFGLREIRGKGVGSQYLMFAAYTAQQLISWYRDNVFCGRCGARTIHSERERAVVCPECGRTIFPRIVPAVIVAVTNGDQIVLTKYSGRDVPYYALVAGFTEIGETLEETVAREVMEEVGLKVRNIRYYKSQPWAMADDILMGFFCDVDGDTQIRLDTSELKEGLWVNREDVILQPDTYSLTNEMMTLFKEGKEPRA